jgi:hypothetical protein
MGPRLPTDDQTFRGRGLVHHALAGTKAPGGIMPGST